MICNYWRYRSKMTTFWIPPLVNSKDGVFFAMLFTQGESRRTSDFALLRVRSKELRLTLKTPWLWSPPTFATLGFTMISAKKKPHHVPELWNSVSDFVTYLVSECDWGLIFFCGIDVAFFIDDRSNASCQRIKNLIAMKTTLYFNCTRKRQDRKTEPKLKNNG
jgi:hypothetical protein